MVQEREAHRGSQMGCEITLSIRAVQTSFVPLRVANDLAVALTWSSKAETSRREDFNVEGQTQCAQPDDLIRYMCGW